MLKWLVIATFVGCKADPGSVVPTEPEPATDCAIGSEGCVCTDGGSCDAGMVCNGAQICEVPACPVGSLDCPCTDGGTCDGGLTCHEEACLPTPVCGNDVVDFDETCDDGNDVTEACEYGETACEVCDSSCTTAAGATSVCGDGSTDPIHEACDDPGAGTDCDYGDPSCQVCTSSCTLVAGTPHVCGDGFWDDPYEDCDGASYCDSDCDFIGDLYEYNDGVGDAVVLQAGPDGTFSHPLDMVHGPGYDFASGTFESPDYFEIEVCAGGTLTARIDFVAADGNLELLVGRREGFGTPSGPPPVLFSWSSDSTFQDHQELVVDSPSAKTHWIKVAAYENALAYLFNSYTLTGSVVCP